MRASPKIQIFVQIEVTDPAAFKAAAARCSELSSAEPGTLTYDWYIDENGATARLVEAYATLADLVAHATGPVATEAGPRLMQTCKFRQMDILGDTGDLAEQPTFWPTSAWGRPFASLTA